jgi:hypothetical protein
VSLLLVSGVFADTANRILTPIGFEEEGSVAIFLLEFKDLNPSLASTQTVEYDTLEETIGNVITAVRDIIADHIRHGKVLTMTSVTVSNEANSVLKEVTVVDAIWDLLAGVRLSMKDPSAPWSRIGIQAPL